MQEIMIKAFGYFEPATEDCLQKLQTLCRSWYLDTQIFTLEKGGLHIYHEGEYFPDEEVSAILAKYITENSQGKLDIIDYEAWKLRRYFLEMHYQRKEDLAKGIVYSRSSSLDYALEASMRNNSQVEIK